MNLGIVGSGNIVKEIFTFIDDIGFEKIYICGRRESMEKVTALKDRYRLAGAFFDYDAMLAAAVDVVYIGIINTFHYEYAKKALKAGKHVILEKPSVMKEAELTELLELADKNGVYLIEGMSIYHMPAFKAMEASLSAVGEIKMAVLNYSQFSGRWKEFKAGLIPSSLDVRCGGGSLSDINVYNIAFMVGLFGMPKSVTYTANIEKDVDTSGTAVCTYDGFQVVCVGAKDSSSDQGATIQGVKGTIFIPKNVNGMTQYSVFTRHNGQTHSYGFSNDRNRLYYEFVEFKRIIAEKDAEAVSRLNKYSIDTIKVLDACRACIAK